MGKIEWTDRSDWNPIRGCTRVSPGCGGPGTQGGCYAEGMAARFSKPGQWGHGFAEMRNGAPRWAGKVELQKDRVALPLSWRKPAPSRSASHSIAPNMCAKPCFSRSSAMPPIAPVFGKI